MSRVAPMQLLETSVVSQKYVAMMKSVDSCPGQGTKRSDSLCYREHLQRRMASSGAEVKYAN